MKAHSQSIVVYKTDRVKVRVIEDKSTHYTREGATKYWGVKTHESSDGFSLVEVVSSAARNQHIKTHWHYPNIREFDMGKWGIYKGKDTGLTKIVVANDYVEII